MNLSREAMDAIEAARREGRVTEGPAAPTPPCPVSVDSDTIGEKAFMWQVINYAEDHGWKVYHTYRSDRSEKGFPDLVLVRGCVIYAELKTEKGKATKEQEEWLTALKAANQEVYLWRPSDRPSIERILQ